MQVRADTVDLVTADVGRALGRRHLLENACYTDAEHVQAACPGLFTQCCSANAGSQIWHRDVPLFSEACPAFYPYPCCCSTSPGLWKIAQACSNTKGSWHANKTVQLVRNTPHAAEHYSGCWAP